MEEFKKYFFKPLFIIIFRTKILISDPYSIFMLRVRQHPKIKVAIRFTSTNMMMLSAIFQLQITILFWYLKLNIKDNNYRVYIIYLKHSNEPTIRILFLGTQQVCALKAFQGIQSQVSKSLKRARVLQRCEYRVLQKT